MALIISPSPFSAAEITALMRAGFLTSSIQGLNSANVFVGPDPGSAGTLTSISSISKAASGSMAAIGGVGAIYGAGGRGGIRRSSSQLEESEQKTSETSGEGVELRLSLPSTGAYLKVRLFLRYVALTYHNSLVTRHIPEVVFVSPSMYFRNKICLITQLIF